MTIFLLILKILGIVLLSILGLLLLILLLLLFAPFRYKLQGEYDENTIDAEVSLRWLFIKAIVAFEKTAGLSVKAKVIGIPVYKKEIPLGKKKKDEDALDDDLLEEALQAEEEKEEAEAMNNTADKPADIKTENSKPDESKPESEKKEKKKKDKKSDDKKEDQEDEKTDEASDELIESEETAKQEKKPLSEKIDDILEKINQKVEMVQTKIDHVEQFLDKDFVQKTIRNALVLLKKILMSIRPRKGDVKMVLGLKSAAETGMMLAKIAPLYPLYGKWLQLTPDFYNKRTEAKGYIKGRIILGVIVFPALIFIIKSSTRRTIKLAKKI